MLTLMLTWAWGNLDIRRVSLPIYRQRYVPSVLHMMALGYCRQPQVGRVFIVQCTTGGVIATLLNMDQMCLDDTTVFTICSSRLSVSAVCTVTKDVHILR